MPVRPDQSGLPMSVVEHLLPPERDEPAGAATPQVFKRVIATPSGPPWRQVRAAQLEARHGAPLPIGELMFRLKRIAPWSLGQPGRFAAFYIRTREYRSAFEAIVDVEGTPVTVAFGASAKQGRQLQTLGALT